MGINGAMFSVKTSVCNHLGTKKNYRSTLWCLNHCNGDKNFINGQTTKELKQSTGMEK